MNAREELQRIYNHTELTKHWVHGRLARSVGAFVTNSNFLIEAAEELKKLQQARLEELARDGPRVFLNGGEVTLILLRDGKEKVYEFGERLIHILYTRSDTMRATFKLEGPPDSDGSTHFVRVDPADFGQTALGIQVSAWEANIINRSLYELFQYEWDD
jgi:hypothetical protein